MKPPVTGNPFETLVNGGDGVTLVCAFRQENFSYAVVFANGEYHVATVKAGDGSVVRSTMSDSVFRHWLIWSDETTCYDVEEILLAAARSQTETT